MPTLGNGHLATTVFGDGIYMNGFYSGVGGELSFLITIYCILCSSQLDVLTEMCKMLSPGVNYGRGNKGHHISNSDLKSNHPEIMYNNYSLEYKHKLEPRGLK